MENVIQQTLRTIFRPHKGILAADERPSSMDRRLQKYGISPGEESRDRYRSLLFSTPDIDRSISGVILSEETFLDHRTKGVLTREFLNGLGIAVGVKVDQGLEPYGDSKVLMLTKGLKDLPGHCHRYKRIGASFLKWRSVVPVAERNDDFLQEVSCVLAEYAQIALENGLVPIIEPEVLLSGKHSIDESAEALSDTIAMVFQALKKKGCPASKCILKTSFAVDGLDAKVTAAEEAATRTLQVFNSLKLGGNNGFYGIVFLSGGLPSDRAIQYIQTIRALGEKQGSETYFNKPLTFSYGRALQDPALDAWRGDDENALKAQVAFTQALQSAVKTFKGPEPRVV